LIQIKEIRHFPYYFTGTKLRRKIMQTENKSISPIVIIMSSLITAVTVSYLAVY